MSYCRTSVRSRALVPTALGLALVVGPLAVLAPTRARAVTTPTHADVALANPADALAYDDGRLLTNGGPGASRAIRVDSVAVPVPGQVTVATGTTTYSPSFTNSGDRHTFATSAGVDLVGRAGRVVAKRGTTTLLDVPAPSGDA